MTLIIPGRLPGLNEYTKANRTNPHTGAKMKREAEELIGWEIIAARLPKPIPFRVRIRFAWFEKDRRRDPDNIASAKKYILDALVRAKVLQGDGWRHIGGFEDRFAVDARRPRVEVEFFEETGGVA